VPAGIVVVERLPLSGRGKVDRVALERLADEAGDAMRHGSAAPYAAPGSAVEESIAEVFQRILGVDRIGVDDRFFDLGAYSVTIVRIYRELRAVLDASFPLMHMFEHPTIRQLAAALDASGNGGDAVDDAFARASRRRARRRASRDLGLLGPQ
jgi:acyl carrier protein